MNRDANIKQGWWQSPNDVIDSIIGWDEPRIWMGMDTADQADKVKAHFGGYVFKDQGQWFWACTGETLLTFIPGFMKVLEEVGDPHKRMPELRSVYESQRQFDFGPEAPILNPTCCALRGWWI